ncbi:MAG: glycosyltransferase family 2 protein [Nostoc indistinguendum CM1-VF10]|jgi:glycosyltransferase involved in cell wall biosynthesis|nr:glycosyltransferase family 2 protein [Nostoc indistinguendum CM1-VF10]
MKIYAICLVKNEDDIISQTLSHAIKFCDKVIVLDNGSTDETWSIVQSLAKYNSQIIPFGQLKVPFQNGLRSLVYNEFHHTLTDEDWWLRLDGDEFLLQDPRPVIQKALDEKSDFIKAWQAQFYFTEADHHTWLAGQDNQNIPIFKRRRFYCIDWREYRLFRNQQNLPWDGQISDHWPTGLNKVCSQYIYNRHYQYRDPLQIQKRLDTRNSLNKNTLEKEFKHVLSKDWHSEIRSSKGLDYYKDDEPMKLDIFNFYRKRLSLALLKKLPVILQSK